MQKSIIKNLIYIIFITLVICMISTISQAATLNISKSKSEITIGESFTVTITAGNGAGRIDVSATNATLSSSGEFLDNSSITVTVTPTATGTVTVTAAGILSDYTIEEDQNFSKSVSVNVKEKVTPPPVTSQEPEQPETPKTDTPTQTTKSNNSNLKSITISQEGLTPAFDKSTTNYVLNVGNDVESIQIDAIPEDSKAKVTVSGNTELVEGENQVKILVKAEDGTSKTYNITVIKAARLDILLDKLEILGVSDEQDDIVINLIPEFKPETFYYTIDIDENIKSLDINATSIVDDAIIEITGNENLIEGENTITITLKMPEGEEKIEYKIIANKTAKALNSELDNNLENEENKSWLTPKVNRILTTTFISIIAIAGIVYGVIEYRYTKQNPKEKKVKDKNKNEFENKELNNINEKTDNEPKKTLDKSGKHF